MRKRSSGGGSIRRLPSGTWRGQVMDGYQDNGKRRIVSFTAATKGELLDKIRNFQNKRDILGAALTEKMPFNQWADSWYEDYESEVQPSTYANYQYTLKILKEYFGATEIKEIKAMHINRFLDQLVKKGVSLSYISKCRAMLIQIFDAAEANEMIVSNPARKSKISKNKTYAGIFDIQNKKGAFSDAELDTLMKYLPDDLMGHSIRLLLGTGMRAQELLALTPADISEDGQTIIINKAIKTVNGTPTLGIPKSTKGFRLVPVPEAFRQNAQYLRSHCIGNQIWASNRESGLYDVGVFRKKYYRVLSGIPGVRQLSPHCCRHTYITMLEKRGVPLEQIARLAGHSRISTTDHYLHTDLTTLSQAVSVLNYTNKKENDYE